MEKNGKKEYYQKINLEPMILLTPTLIMMAKLIF